MKIMVLLLLTGSLEAATPTITVTPTWNRAVVTAMRTTVMPKATSTPIPTAKRTPTAAATPTVLPTPKAEPTPRTLPTPRIKDRSEIANELKVTK